jgi:hypothetical protein
MADAEFIEQLRQNLPRLLREHPEVRHERLDSMLDAFPFRWEYAAALEEICAWRGVIEEFAEERFAFAERLLLRDESGEVYGIAGAEVEFDLYADNGRAYLVEVKSHLKSGDVLAFYKKVTFAEKKLGRRVTPLMIALSTTLRAEQQMRELGIKYRVRAVTS